MDIPCLMSHITTPKNKLILEGIENKQRLQTLSIDNAWSNKNFLFYLTFRMLQHTSSEVNGYNCYKQYVVAYETSSKTRNFY